MGFKCLEYVILILGGQLPKFQGKFFVTAAGIDTSFWRL